MKAGIRIIRTSGQIEAPASKSCMQRALAISLLAKGKSVISNLSTCDDVAAALSMIKDLGATVTETEDTITVIGKGVPVPVKDVINCGESGLASRLFIPLASLSDREITIQGRGSLLSRKMEDFSAPFNAMGVEFQSASGFLPVKVKGPLKGGKANVNGAMSSQFLSGLLIALPITGNESTIEVNGLASKPYIDITIDIMRMAGVNVINRNYEEFIVNAGQKYHPFAYKVEGDWSGASAFLVMGAVNGNITVKGLNHLSYQADSKILEVLKECGAQVTITGDAITVSSSDLQPFVFDATDAPDLVPSLAVLALACKGQSSFHHIERLRVKESDRVMSISEMIHSLGGKVREESGSLIIDGGLRLKGGVVESFNDHRIVMAAAAASLLCENSILINGTESVNKSYPEFMDHLFRVGATIQKMI